MWQELDSPRRYPYFDTVVGLVWSNDPASYAGGSAANGRASHAGLVKGGDPDKKGYHGPPGWGLVVGLTTPPCITYLLRNFKQSLGVGIKSYKDCPKNWRRSEEDRDAWRRRTEEANAQVGL
jgi:hypothetical protein